MKIVGIVVGTIVLIGSMYLMFFIKGDSVNRLEREVFISRGMDDFNVFILNAGTQPKYYHAVTKVTSEIDKGYYFFWAEVNGKKVYVQSPIALTVIEQK